MVLRKAFHVIAQSSLSLSFQMSMAPSSATASAVSIISSIGFFAIGAIMRMSVLFIELGKGVDL